MINTFAHVIYSRFFINMRKRVQIHTIDYLQKIHFSNFFQKTEPYYIIFDICYPLLGRKS